MAHPTSEINLGFRGVVSWVRVFWGVLFRVFRDPPVEARP